MEGLLAECTWLIDHHAQVSRSAALSSCKCSRQLSSYRVNSTVQAAGSGQNVDHIAQMGISRQYKYDTPSCKAVCTVDDSIGYY
jgi:hypothetical protein